MIRCVLPLALAFLTTLANAQTANVSISLPTNTTYRVTVSVDPDESDGLVNCSYALTGDSRVRLLQTQSGPTWLTDLDKYSDGSYRLETTQTDLEDPETGIYTLVLAEGIRRRGTTPSFHYASAAVLIDGEITTIPTNVANSTSSEPGNAAETFTVCLDTTLIRNGSQFVVEAIAPDNSLGIHSVSIDVSDVRQPNFWTLVLPDRQNWNVSQSREGSTVHASFHQTARIDGYGQGDPTRNRFLNGPAYRRTHVSHATASVYDLNGNVQEAIVQLK